MKKSIFGIALAAAALTASLGASAAPTLTFNDNVGSPGIYASFAFNGNWSIGRENGIELALRAKNRETFALIDGTLGTYQVDPGLYLGVGPKAKWNYEFSVNSSAYQGGILTYLLSVDHDPSVGMNFSTADPLILWTDNFVPPSASGPLDFSDGFQNSQNVGFPDTPGGAFNVGQEGLYAFKLEAFDGTRLVDSVSMMVKVGDNVPAQIPEPGTLSLAMGAIAGLTFIRRRKSKGLNAT